MGADSELALTFLGQFRVARRGQVLTRFESDKVRALLAFLAVERQSVHSRDALAALLWPGYSEDSARVNLRHTLHQLRMVLGKKESDAPTLIVTRQTVQFQPAFDAEIDVERFSTLLAEVRAHAHADPLSCAHCRENLLKAIALHNGEFLSNLSLADCAPFEEWRRVKQEQLHIALSDALHTLAEMCLSAQRYEEALTYARRQIELEPWREDAHRQIMRAFAASGQRDAAMAQYALMRQTLASEIGVAPSPETEALHERIKLGRHDTQTHARALPVTPPRLEWGDIPAADIFHGRANELAQLQKWLVQDRCRFVSILGIGGMGKTTLAAAAARAVAGEFELVIWRSLLNAPPLGEIMRGWLQALSHYTLTVLPDSPDEQLNLLLNYLMQRRCLMVLDNVESIFHAGAGEPRPGYEPYARLFARLADSDHHSCLLITSREQPNALARIGRDRHSVRQLPVSGLDLQSGVALLQGNGLRASNEDMAALVRQYSGNPLALQLVANTIADYFDGDVAAFQREEGVLFDGIRAVLDQQFERLSELERDILVWLAIEREPVSVKAVQANLVRPVALSELLSALDALQARALLEKTADGLTLQNVVIEYLTERLTAEVCAEIGSGAALQTSAWLHRFALMKAQAKEYVRQSQSRLIIDVIVARLSAQTGPAELVRRLRRMIADLRQYSAHKPGYAAGNLLNVLLHMGANMGGADLSHLHVRQAYLRSAKLQSVSFAHADLSDTVFADTFSTMPALAFSRDGRTLAGGTSTGDIRLWRAGTWQPIGMLQGHTRIAMALAFCSDESRVLASCGEDGTVRFWNLAQLDAPAQIVHTSQGFMRAIAASPFADIVASAGDDAVIRLWDAHSRRQIAALHGHTGIITSLAFSPDGRLLASCSGDHTVRLWPVDEIHTAGDSPMVRDAMRIAHAWQNDADDVWSIAISPAGDLLAGVNRNGALWTYPIHEPGNARIRVLRERGVHHTTLAFSPDGQTLAAASEMQAIWLIDPRDGATKMQLDGHAPTTLALAFAPGGQVLASSGTDRILRVWDRHSGRSVQAIAGAARAFRHVVCAPDGKTLVTCAADRVTRIWDLSIDTDALAPIASECRHELTGGHTGGIWAVAVDATSRVIASAGEDGKICLWEHDSGRQSGTLVGHIYTVTALAFGSDGRTLASCSPDQTIRLWDYQSMTPMAVLVDDSPSHSVHEKSIWCVALSPKNNLLAAGCSDGTIALWDIRDVRQGKLVGKFDRHSGWVRSLAFSPDGSLLVSGSNDRTARIWNVHDRSLRHELRGHTDWVTSVAFHPTGNSVASASFDQSLRIWDVATGAWQPPQRFGAPMQHSKGIVSLAYHPNGRVLVSASHDERLKFWDAGSQTLLKDVPAPGPYSDMDISDATGLSDGQRATLLALGAIANPPHRAHTWNADAGTVARAAQRQHEHALSNLPADTTPFVGREMERESICQLLQSGTTRLVTLIGPGGVGKTRLALACARKSAETFIDGTFLIALDALPMGAGAEQVASAIGRALRLELPEVDSLSHLTQSLQPRHLLLILDNIEHLLTNGAAAVQVVMRILEAAPHIQLLATSRMRLSLRAETVYAVDGLPTTVTPTGKAAPGSNAVDFFVQCARRSAPEFAASQTELQHIQTICELLHGLPLAIEMTAAQVHMRPIKDIASALSKSLTALSADWQDAPPRHRSMRAAFIWSWQLLDDALRDVLPRLAVFRGGFSSEAAMAVAGASNADLTRLANASLLVVSRRAGDIDRCSLHITVNDFATDLLITARGYDDVQARHANYFLDMTRRAEAALTGKSAEGDLEWTLRLQNDHDNILLGLERLESEGRLDDALALCAHMHSFWNTRGYSHNGIHWLQRLLDAAHDAERRNQRPPSAPQAKALVALAHMSIDRGDSNAARPLLDEALAMATRLDEPGIRARALLFQGVLNGRDGLVELAMNQLGESLEASRRLNERYTCALAHNYLGALEANIGHVERARANFSECVRLLLDLGIECDRVFALRQSGHLALYSGDLADAAARYAQSVNLGKTIVDYGVQGGYVGLVSGIAACAALLAARGDDMDALMLCGAVRTIERQTAVAMWPADRARFERTLAELTQRLGQDTTPATLAQGESLTIQQAVDRCQALG